MTSSAASCITQVSSEFYNLLETIAKSLVDYPDEIVIRIALTVPNISAEIVAREEDKRRIIGKSGRTINSMRTIFHCAAAKYQLKTSLAVASGVV
jgi:predicted RNA-binding protein YlqC (UPF0109 family)